MAEETNPVKEPQDEPTLETSPSDVAKLTLEALSDEEPADDSSETEDTGGGTPLHELLLKMAGDNEGSKRKDDLDELSRMLHDGVNVHAKDADGETALHLAAANGIVEAAKWLMETGANVSELDNEKRQPLHKACSEGRIELVEMLLKQGADINARQHKNATPLHEACWPGHLDVVKLLLKGGANTQVTEEDGWSPLHAASQSGHAEVIQALLDEDKTNIDATEGLEGWTAINLAIYNGHVDAISTLLRYEASVSIQDNDGWTPLMTATKQKHEDIVRKLLDHKGLDGKGASELETRDESGHTPLLTASIDGFSAGASLLIAAGADRNVQSTRSKATPLIAASCWGYGAIVKALLEPSGQTDVNSQDEDGWTAVHFASNRGNSKVVALLLRREAKVDLVNNDEKTALHLASQKGNENVVKLLLRAEANVDTTDQDGETALHLASGAGLEDCSEQNDDNGGGDDDIGFEDLSPEDREMMEFRSGQHAAVVELLLNHKANPDAKTNKKETALHLAVARGDQDRLKHILNFAAQEHVDDEIKWAIDCLETHETAKWLMEARWKRKKMPTPAGSDHWDVIQWAAYSQLPEVLSSLIAKSPGSSNLQGGLKLALKSTLKSTLQSLDKPTEGEDRNKQPEVLSLLIENCPQTPDIKAELRSALEVTLKLARAKRASPGAEHTQLLQVLSLLITSFSGTPEIETELKSTLELVKTPEEGVTYEQLSPVLWLLIANSLQTPDIDAAVESALKSTSKLAKRTEDRSQDPKPISVALRAPKAEAGAFPHKGKNKNKDPEGTEPKRETSQAAASTARAAKEPQTDYLYAIMDILRDPHFSQTHKDSKIDKLPKHNDELLEVLKTFEATVVQFYKGEGESGTFRRYRSLKEVIYDKGPERIMEQTISDIRKILGGRPELVDPIIYLSTEPKFTWVHLPATNMVWMNDILLRIMKDERCEAQPYHELKAFFRDSWAQVPDRTSSSRSMRPRTLVRRREKEADGKKEKIKKEEEEEIGKRKNEGNKGQKKKKDEKMEEEEEEDKEEEKDKGEEPGKVKNESGSEEDQRKKNKLDFGAASATYMPYFCFSTQYRDEASLGKEQKKFNDMKTAYEGLKDSKSPVIHDSPTLDEWYYHFATDEKSTKDRKSRNRTQVVTKAIEGRRSAEDVEEHAREERKEPRKWTLLRVNQLWVWTFANKWLITATSCLFDGSHDTLVEGILDQLGKEAEAGGSASQPESADDMSRFIVDYCIGSYERLPKSQGQGSIRQIFSNTINEIGREEAALFEEFRNQTERWREQIPSEPKKPLKRAPSLEFSSGVLFEGSSAVSSNGSSEVLSGVSTYGDIRVAIKKAERMYCEIKDIRDELNILKSAVQHQKTVEAGLHRRSLDGDLTAAYIVNDLKEMDNSAERIQSAINTTLSLLQSENANLQATLSLRQSQLSNQLAELATKQGEEAKRQGKTLMVFTVVTILFLPLSFLSSLFALDVASFQQAPGWAFAIIFAVSFAFFTITALAALRWGRIKKEKVDKAEDRNIGERVPKTPREPTVGEIGSRKPPLLSSLRGRLRRRKSDAV